MANTTVIEIEIDSQKATAQIKGLGSSIKRQGERSSRSFSKSINSSITSLGSLIAKAGVAATALGAVFTGLIGRKAFSAASSLETIETRFITLLGSAEAAQKQVEDLVDFAARTPFQLEGLANASAQLLSFGFEQDKIIDQLKILGDIAAGSGSDIQEIALIFGQISAAGKLTGERLLQLQERAIPIGRALADSLGVAESEIRGLVTAGRIGFPQVQKALRELTEQGGLFENATIRQSQTLNGLTSTLRDNVFAAFAALGKALGGTFRGVLNNLITVFQVLTTAIKENSEAIGEFISNGIAVFNSVIKSTINLVAGLFFAFQQIANTPAIASIFSVLAGSASFLFNTLLQLTDLVGGVLIKSFSAFFNGALLGFNLLRGAAFTALGAINEVAKAVGLDLGISEAINAELNQASQNVSIFADNIREDLGSAFGVGGNVATLSEEIKNAFAGIAEVTTDPETGETFFDKLFSSFNDENSEEIASRVSSLVEKVKGSLGDLGGTSKKTLTSLQKTIGQGFSRVASEGLQRLGASLVEGAAAFDNFGRSVLGILGDLAIQIGQTTIATGIAMSALGSLNPGQSILAGAALIAIGGLLKSLSSGESGLGTPVAGSGFGGTGIDNPEIGEGEGPPDPEDLREQTNVQVVVQGDILDNGEQTAQRIAELLSDSFDSQDIVVRGRA